MKQLYLVFPYVIDGQNYVEAYPIHAPNMNISHCLPEDMPYTYVNAVSRNQARKAGYRLYVDSSGKGFNKMKIYKNKVGG